MSKVWPNWGDRSCKHKWEKVDSDPRNEQPFWFCDLCRALTFDDPNEKDAS